MPLALGTEAVNNLREEVEFMKELAKHIELEAPKNDKFFGSDTIIKGDVGKDLRFPLNEKAIMRASLQKLLEEIAPNNYAAKQWGSLRRVRMSDNSYRWLCESCRLKRHPATR